MNELIAFSLIHLSLSLEEIFWLTPQLLDNLIYEYRIREYRNDYRIALVCTVLANIHRKQGTRAFKPEDFIGQMPKRKELIKPKRKGWQDQLKTIELLNIALCGNDQRRVKEWQ